MQTFSIRAFGYMLSIENAPDEAKKAIMKVFENQLKIENNRDVLDKINTVAFVSIGIISIALNYWLVSGVIIFGSLLKVINYNFIFKTWTKYSK